MIKRNFYLFALLLLTIGASSCSKDDEPEPLPAVVGKWEYDYVILSDFPTSAGLNGRYQPGSAYFLFEESSKLYIINDGRVFLESYSYNYDSADYDGTWIFENNILKLTYSDSSVGTLSFNYGVVKGVEQLTSDATTFSIPVDSTTTLTGKIQYVYRR